MPYQEKAGGRGRRESGRCLQPAGTLGGLLLVALSAPQIQAGERPGNIEEIVVIGAGVGDSRLGVPNGAGSRLGLSALETPASIDMVTREEIVVKGDDDALTAITRTAGMAANANPGNGGSAVSMRGFSGHNSTTFTYDGTRLYVAAGTVTFPADTWTVERVEVLRGAGSVINGIGAIGATINYVPRTPAPGQPSFEALLAAGSHDKRRLALGGGTDLAERWSLRLDAAFQETGSNVERHEEERRVLAGTLLYRPGENLSFKLSADYAAFDADSPYFGTPLMDGRANDDLRKQNYNFGDGFLEYEDIWVRLHTDWQIRPGLRLRNAIYAIDAERQWQNLEMYAYNEVTGLIDRDGFSYYGIIHDQQQIGTQTELQIESEIGGRHNRISIGFDLNGIDLDYHNNWSQGIFYEGNSVPVFGWQPDRLGDADIPMVLAYSTDSTQYGLFFDNVLTLTPRWQAVAGARFDDISYTRRDHALNGNPASSFDADYSELTWRAGLVFQPVETLSLYAQYSRATDPVTSPASMSQGFSDFEPTRGRQFEVGLKQQVLDGRAEFTLALFDIEKTNLVTRLPGSMESRQIGRQKADGIEMTARAMLGWNLRADLNAAWVDAEYREFFLNDQSLAGKRPRGVPKVTANAWMSWAPLESLTLGAGLRHVGSRYTDDNNNGRLPAYTILDAFVTWRYDDRTRVTLRSRNLADEKDYVLSQYGSEQWVFGDTRSFELSLHYRM